MDAFPFAGPGVQAATPRPAQPDSGPSKTDGEAAALFADLIEEAGPTDGTTTDLLTAPDGAGLAVALASARGDVNPPVLPQVDDITADPASEPVPGQAETGAPVQMVIVADQPVPPPSRLESILSKWSGMSAGVETQPAAEMSAEGSALPLAEEAVVSEESARPNVPAATMPAPFGPEGPDAGDPKRHLASVPSDPRSAVATDTEQAAGPAGIPPPPASAMGVALSASPAKPRPAKAHEANPDAAAAPVRAKRGPDERALARLYDLAAYGAGPAPSARLTIASRAANGLADLTDSTRPAGTELRFDLGMPRDLAIGPGRAEGMGHLSPRVPDHHAPSIGRQIAEVAVTLGQDEIELALAPEELGRLRLRVSRGEGQGALVTVWFERPEVLETARRHLDQLIQDLRDSGLDGATLDLRGDSEGRRSHSEAADAHGNASAGGGEGGPDTGTPLAAPTLGLARQLSDRQLDIRV